MTVDTEEDLLGLKEAGRVVGLVLKEMVARTEPGITTGELDALGEEMLEAHGARSAPRTVGFPAATCISVGNEVAHGIPGERVIQAGDLVNIDVSAELGGYFADTGRSFVVPPVKQKLQRLCLASEEALKAAMKEARAGARLHVIGRAIERVAKAHGLKVIRNLCSHGVGRSLHEEPEMIPGYFDPRDRRVLHEGQVITIEPFLSTHGVWAEEQEDGWTLWCGANNFSAQHEHTLVITKGHPIVLTAVSS